MTIGIPHCFIGKSNEIEFRSIIGNSIKAIKLNIDFDFNIIMLIFPGCPIWPYDNQIKIHKRNVCKNNNEESNQLE